jgi:hypothetical protein
MSTYIRRASRKPTEHDHASILETHQISFSFQTPVFTKDTQLHQRYQRFTKITK